LCAYPLDASFTLERFCAPQGAPAPAPAKISYPCGSSSSLLRSKGASGSFPTSYEPSSNFYGLRPLSTIFPPTTVTRDSAPAPLWIKISTQTRHLRPTEFSRASMDCTFDPNDHLFRKAPRVPPGIAYHKDLIFSSERSVLCFILLHRTPRPTDFFVFSHARFIFFPCGPSLTVHIDSVLPARCKGVLIYWSHARSPPRTQARL